MFGYQNPFRYSPDVELDQLKPLGKADTSIILGQRSNQGLSDIAIGSREDHGRYIELNETANAGSVSVLFEDVVSRSMEFVGDVNGDGLEDVLVGNPMESECYLYVGSEEGMERRIPSWVLRGGKEENDNFGWALSGGLDVNGDRYGDMLISARNGGTLYVIYGKELMMSGNADLNVKEMRLTDGFRVHGFSWCVLTGLSVTMLKGFTGFEVGGKKSNVSLAFSSISSSMTSVVTVLPLNASLSDVRMDLLSPQEHWNILGPELTFTGFSLRAVGDVNGDGMDDLGIGSIPYRGGYAEQVTYVILGSSVREVGKDLDLSGGVSGIGFVVRGGGFMVGRVGDVNGDGVDDMMVSRFFDWQRRGNAYVSVWSSLKNVTSSPTYFPSSRPSSPPSESPTSSPSELREPTTSPKKTVFPTSSPSVHSRAPAQTSPFPTIVRSSRPTSQKPSIKPSRSPTRSPSRFPSLLPTTRHPTESPSFQPVVKEVKTSNPSLKPSRRPVMASRAPVMPSESPTYQPFTNNTDDNPENYQVLTIPRAGSYETDPSVSQQVVISVCKLQNLKFTIYRIRFAFFVIFTFLLE